jgi:hypothetical protein
VYILNSLHARPYEGSAVYDLLFAALPHTIVRTDVTRIEDPNPNAHGQISSPHAPFGIVTLRQIKFDPIPRFLSGRNYSDRACRFFFGKHPSALEEEIRPMGVRQEDGPTRVPSSKGMTKEILSFGTRPQEFHLESIGIKIDSNACIESDEEDDEVMDGVVGLDGRLNKIWHQFLSDVVQKCPNPKGRGYSYCRLTHEGKLKASKHTYGPDLSKTFRAVWVKKVSNKEWNSNIDTLFPPKGTVRVHGPSYQNCRYFSSWMKLMGSVSKQAAVSISAEIRAIVINDLRWLPAVEDKRMWRSGKGIMNGFSHYPASHDSSEVTQAPYVLLSPKLQQIVWQDRPQDVMFGPTGEVYVDGEEDDIDVMDNQEDRQLWPGPAVAPLAQEEEESSGGEN